MTIDAGWATQRRRRLVSAFAEGAEVCAGLAVRPGATTSAIGSQISVLVRPMPDHDLLVSLRIRGEEVSALAGTSLVLSPAGQSGRPVRYGQLDARGQLRFRDLEDIQYALALRPPWWLEDDRVEAIVAQPAELGLVVVGEPSLPPAGLTFRTADGSLATTLEPCSDTTRLTLRGPVGDRTLDNRPAWCRADADRLSAPSATTLRWDEIERSCQAHLELGPWTAGRIHLALPATIRPDQPASWPTATAEPGEVDWLIAQAGNLAEKPDTRVEALRNLTLITDPADDLRSLVALLGDGHAEVRLAAAVVLAPTGVRGCAEVIGRTLSSRDAPVRLEAARALVRLPVDAASRLVVTALRHDDLDVRQAAGQVLGTLPKRSDSLPGTPGARRRRLSALAVLGGTAAVVALAALAGGRRSLPVGMTALLSVAGLLIAYTLQRQPSSAPGLRVRARMFGLYRTVSRPGPLADAAALVLIRRIERFPRALPEVTKSIAPQEHGGGILQVLAIAWKVRRDMTVEARRLDATLRLGRWLVPSGLGTFIVGLLGQALRFRWSAAQTGLGLAVVVTGFYLGAQRDHLDEESGGVGTRRWLGKHRALLALSLLSIIVLAWVTAARFNPPGPSGLAATVAYRGMQLGALCALGACGATFFAVTVFHRRRITTGAGVVSDNFATRARLTRAATIAAGLTCLVYGTTHLVLAAAVAPTPELRAALTISGAFLLLAAAQCRGPAPAFPRVVLTLTDGARRGEGVAAIEEAVAVRRRLADDNPAFLPDLACKLDDLAALLGHLGRREEAGNAQAGAAAIRVRLQKDGPANRAAALHELSLILRTGGQSAEALAATQEAVAIRRDLAEHNGAYCAVLADSLNIWAVCLGEGGRHEAALAAAEEAADIRRGLVAADPANLAYRVALAASLSNQSLRLGDLDRDKEGLYMAKNAVATLRRVA